MKQNHSRSAQETKLLIKELTLGRQMTAHEICKELDLGYSTVMKYRKQIQREIEQKPIEEKEEGVQIMSNQITFKINNDSFEVEVREKRGMKIYKLSDLVSGITKHYSVDIESMTSKTIDNGEEFIYGTYFIPIANEVLDYDFTSSVKDVLFQHSSDYRYNEVIKSFNNLIGFLGSPIEEEREELMKVQNSLLKELDGTEDIEGLTNISSQIKKVRAEWKELDREDKIKEMLLETFNSNSISLEQIKQEIQNLSI